MERILYPHSGTGESKSPLGNSGKKPGKNSAFIVDSSSYKPPHHGSDHLMALMAHGNAGCPTTPSLKDKVVSAPAAAPHSPKFSPNHFQPRKSLVGRAGICGPIDAMCGPSHPPHSSPASLPPASLPEPGSFFSVEVTRAPMAAIPSQVVAWECDCSVVFSLTCHHSLKKQGGSRFLLSSEIS